MPAVLKRATSSSDPDAWLAASAVVGGLAAGVLLALWAFEHVPAWRLWLG